MGGRSAPRSGGGGWRWTDGIRDLVAAILEGREPANAPDHALHVLDVMAKCQEAIRTGQTLAVTSTFEQPELGPAATRVAPHLDHAPT